MQAWEVQIGTEFHQVLCCLNAPHAPRRSVPVPGLVIFAYFFLSLSLSLSFHPFPSQPFSLSLSLPLYL